MNWVGIELGLFSALAVGLGFVWVIRLEYLVGAYVWKWVAGMGLLLDLFDPPLERLLVRVVKRIVVAMVFEELAEVAVVLIADGLV